MRAMRLAKPGGLEQLAVAGIEPRKFHALRHSSALDALDAGISVEKVQRELGHASLTTTMKYLRGRDEDRRRGHRSAPRRP